jgi:hypothetical protein
MVGKTEAAAWCPRRYPCRRLVGMGSLRHVIHSLQGHRPVCMCQAEQFRFLRLWSLGQTDGHVGTIWVKWVSHIRMMRGVAWFDGVGASKALVHCGMRPKTTLSGLMHATQTAVRGRYHQEGHTALLARGTRRRYGRQSVKASGESPLRHAGNVGAAGAGDVAGRRRQTLDVML